jgi:hypothetical protein
MWNTAVISRITIRCLACKSPVTTRIQVGHENVQRVSAVCPECFTPFRLRLLLDDPPRVRVEFDENCQHSEEEGRVVNIGSGFVLARDRVHEDHYFPSLHMPKPDEAARRAIEDSRPDGYGGPIMVDLTVLLGGLPNAVDRWRLIRNAYRFHRSGQIDRMNDALRQLFDDEFPACGVTIEESLVSFFVRILEPLGELSLQKALQEFSRVRDINRLEFDRSIIEFRESRWDRFDEYMDVIDHFFRAYDEFNQTFMYVRRSLGLPDDPYAASTDFENTRMYYGEAFEVLGGSIDLLASVNNIASGRPFDVLDKLSLRAYRVTDKGRRGETLQSNPVLAQFITEYDNRLRNASHHRWLRLSPDRSQITYRAGGNGEMQSLSYAEYLYRCCSITSQLMLLVCVETLVLRD